MSIDLQPHTRTVFRRAFTAAAWAVLLWCGSRADASCGDYVMVGGRHTAASSNADLPDSKYPAVPRCHGPACSKNSMPPAAPVPKVELPVERWALSDAVDSSGCPFSEPLLADAHDNPCDGC